MAFAAYDTVVTSGIQADTLPVHTFEVMVLGTPCNEHVLLPEIVQVAVSLVAIKSKWRW